MRERATERAPTLMDRITAQLPSLTESERRAARALLARYPTTGLDTVNLFAERAGVSAPTVLRFIGKLGFTGYPEFRRSLWEELEAAETYALNRPPQKNSAADGIAALGAQLSEIATESASMTQWTEIDRLIDLLRDERRTIYIVGGDFTDAAARHLEFHLRKLRPGVRLLDHDLPRRADILTDLKRRDVLVAFDVRRYQADTVAALEFAKSRGAKTVLFTDQWMSEAAKAADIAFRARVDGPSRWDSLVGVIAQVEIVAQAYDERVWASARTRVEAIERARNALMK